MIYLILWGTVGFCLFLFLYANSALKTVSGIEGIFKRMCFFMAPITLYAVLYHSVMAMSHPLIDGTLQAEVLIRLLSYWGMFCGLLAIQTRGVNKRVAQFAGVLAIISLSVVYGVFSVVQIIAPLALLDGLVALGIAPYYGVSILIIGISAGMYLLAARLGRYLRHRRQLNFEIFNTQAVYVLLVVSCLSLIFSYEVVFEEQYRYHLTLWAMEIHLVNTIYILFTAAAATLIGVVVVYVRREHHLQVERGVIDSSKQYLNDLENSYRALRVVKHDYINIMSTIKLFIDSEDMAGLSQYYYQELTEMNTNLMDQVKLMGSLEQLKINEMKSLIMYKYDMANKAGITIKIEINELIESVGVSSAVICQILGVLLDNAIEAAIERQKQIKEMDNHDLMPPIQFSIFSDRDIKSFVVENPWVSQDMSTKELFVQGFSTKGVARGTGLPMVKSYLDKMAGLWLDTTFDERVFTQILKVKDR